MTRVAAILLALGIGAEALGQASPEVRQAPVSGPAVSKLDLHGRVQDKTPILSQQENEAEAFAYAETLAAANRTSATALAEAAHRDVTFAHLCEQPERYRGEVIHMKGRLRRVRRFETPSFIHEGYAIPLVYEGWVFEPELYGANPRCVLFTELPSDVKVAEEMDQRVAFDGYFFKLYRYKAGDGKHDVPLFIAHTLSSLPLRSHAAPGADDAWSATLATAFLGLLATTASLAALLGWWYRRSDRRVREHLAKSQRYETDLNG
jgi:hypothetical protein